MPKTVKAAGHDTRGDRVTSRVKRTLTMIGKRKASEPEKRAKELFAAESKENTADVPKGANFAPTPKDAWGAALVPSPRAEPSLRASPRLQDRKQALKAMAPVGEWEAASPGVVRNFEWDYEQTLLDEWSLAFNGSRPLQLSGKVFNNAGPGLEDGDTVEYTSQIVEVKGRIAKTKSGTKYYLGTPAPAFEAVRIQLCRGSAVGEYGLAAASAMGASAFPFDIERPFNFIDLGPAVPCSSVKLPAVAGWSADSNVALLHHWTLVKNASGYNACVGTVFNCPGAYDGTSEYTTSDVVEIQGRVMRTVDGRAFYLGRRATGEKSVATSAPPLEEEAELGEVDDLLSV